MTDQKHQEPLCLARWEIRRLLDAARRSDERDRLLVELPLNNGLRPGETVSLRASSIHDDYLEVDGKAGRRQVRVAPALARRMAALADEDGVIWRDPNGQPMTTQSLKGAYADLFQRANIPVRPSGAKALRHTFATLFVKAGGNPLDLKDLLGYRRSS